MLEKLERRAAYEEKQKRLIAEAAETKLKGKIIVMTPSVLL